MDNTVVSVFENEKKAETISKERLESFNKKFAIEIETDKKTGYIRIIQDDKEICIRGKTEARDLVNRITEHIKGKEEDPVMFCTYKDEDNGNVMLSPVVGDSITIKSIKDIEILTNHLKDQLR